MSKRTTRRSVSIKGVTYVRAGRAAEALGISISELTEQGIAIMCDKAGVAQVDKAEVKPPEPKPKEPGEHPPACFTF